LYNAKFVLRMVNVVMLDMLLWRKYDVNMTSSGQNDDATRFTKMVKIARKCTKTFSGGASHYESFHLELECVPTVSSAFAKSCPHSWLRVPINCAW
jgi:hypothetical protein